MDFHYSNSVAILSWIMELCMAAFFISSFTNNVIYCYILVGGQLLNSRFSVC